MNMVQGSMSFNEVKNLHVFRARNVTGSRFCAKNVVPLGA